VTYREAIVSPIVAHALTQLGRTARAFAALLVLGGMVASPAPAICAGDCDGDGSVAVDELIRAVNIALGQLDLSVCPAIDADGDGNASIAELLTAVNASLGGCGATPTTAMPTPTTPAEATPTSSETALPTATDTPNQPPATDTPNEPPVLPTASIYRTYPGFDIRLPIGASDPGGGPVRCTASELPAGAQLDPDSGVLSWTPAADQLGPFYVPVSCSDAADPPATSNGQLTFKVMPLDACAIPSCDPASGCTSTLPPPEQTCCQAGPAARVAEPVAGCPEGRVLFVGQNQDETTFGRMQNCDTMRMRNFAQSGAEIQFDIETRCVSTLNRVRIHARMESNGEFHQLLFDAETNKFLDPDPSGFLVQRGLRFGISGPGPFFDLEGAEANLMLTLSDSDGNEVSEQVRLRLTFTPRADLPDVDPTPSPTPAG
jgi:hypothetical protein